MFHYFDFIYRTFIFHFYLKQKDTTSDKRNPAEAKTNSTATTELQLSSDAAPDSHKYTFEEASSHQNQLTETIDMQEATNATTSNSLQSESEAPFKSNSNVYIFQTPAIESSQKTEVIDIVPNKTKQNKKQLSDKVYVMIVFMYFQSLETMNGVPSISRQPPSLLPIQPRQLNFTEF